MKRYFMSLAMLVGNIGASHAVVAHFDSVSCSARYSLTGGYISGQCNRGRCSGYAPSSSLSVSGNCSSSTVAFHATAYLPSEYITGECRNGRFQAYLGSRNLSWTGSCTGGGSFRGNSRELGDYLSGNCSENGSFSAYTSSISGTLNGDCNF